MQMMLPCQWCHLPCSCWLMHQAFADTQEDLWHHRLTHLPLSPWLTLQSDWYLIMMHNLHFTLRLVTLSHVVRFGSDLVTSLLGWDANSSILGWANTFAALMYRNTSEEPPAGAGKSLFYFLHDHIHCLLFFVQLGFFVFFMNDCYYIQ